MEITELTNLISTVGFPIIMCIIMFRYMEKNDDKREAESKELRDAINNNTQVMVRLIDKIDHLAS